MNKFWYILGTMVEWGIYLLFTYSIAIWITYYIFGEI